MLVLGTAIVNLFFREVHESQASFTNETKPLMPIVLLLSLTLLLENAFGRLGWTELAEELRKQQTSKWKAEVLL